MLPIFTTVKSLLCLVLIYSRILTFHSLIGYRCCTATEEQSTHTLDSSWQQRRGDGERRSSISSEISEESVKPSSSQSKLFVSDLLQVQP